MTKIYPHIPANATKDFYEMYEPLDLVEINCTCKPPFEEMCDSCKRYYAIVQTFKEEKDK